MGFENFKKGLEKSARVLAVAGVALLNNPLPGDKVEAAEAQTAPVSALSNSSQQNVSEGKEMPSLSWEAGVMKMHELAVNADHEFTGLVTVATDGTVRFSPLIEGTNTETVMSAQETTAFAREASKDASPKRIGRMHTHPRYTDGAESLDRVTFSKNDLPHIPPSPLDVSKWSANVITGHFVEAGISPENVCLFEFDPRGGYVVLPAHAPRRNQYPARSRSRRTRGVVSDSRATDTRIGEDTLS